MPASYLLLESGSQLLLEGSGGGSLLLEESELARATFEEDVFNAIKADWTADDYKWGSSSDEGVPKIRAVERFGTDAAPPDPHVMVKVTPRRVPTCGGTPRWDGVAELVMRFAPSMQFESENYGGHRDSIVYRIIERLDDLDLGTGISHELGWASVIGTPQTRGNETTIRLAVSGREIEA